MSVCGLLGIKKKCTSLHNYTQTSNVVVEMNMFFSNRIIIVSCCSAWYERNAINVDFLVTYQDFTNRPTYDI